jgi:chromosomal replication initiation ATPase DnaA
MDSDTHFQNLADIVCRTYGEPKDRVLSRAHGWRFTTPRNIIAAIWSQGNSLSDTAFRCGWRTHAHTLHAQRRVLALLENPAHAWRINAIMDEVRTTLPWLAIATPAKDS